MRRFFWIRLRIILRQSRWGFALLGLWFALGTLAFYHFEKLRLTDASMTAVYLRVHPGSLWELYLFPSAIAHRFGAQLSSPATEAFRSFILADAAAFFFYNLSFAWFNNRSGRFIQAAAFCYASRNTAPFVPPYFPPG
jgi:hypothetical protein